MLNKQHNCLRCYFTCSSYLLRNVFSVDHFRLAMRFYLQNLMKSLAFCFIAFALRQFFYISFTNWIFELNWNLTNLSSQWISKPHLFRILIDAVEGFPPNFYVSEKLCEILQLHSDLIQKLRSIVYLLISRSFVAFYSLKPCAKPKAICGDKQ